MNEDKHVINYEKLVVPMSMRSVYWKCYGFPASATGEILTRAKIVCLLCKAVTSYNRNTSNLRMHLQNKHLAELMQLELTAPPRKPKEPKVPKERKRIKKKKEVGNIYSTDVGGSLIVNNNEDANTNVTLESVGDLNETLQDTCTIESLHPYIIPIEAKSVCDVIAEFLVMDMQLPDIVNGKGFQRLIATLKSPCEIPSKSRLVDEIIPRVYETFKDSVQEIFVAIKSEMAITVEEWESATGESYITFSVCYQQEKDDNLFCKVLSTIHCPPTTDASYWLLIFENILEEWKIKTEKVKAVVCGSSRQELIDAILTKGLIVLPCLVQTLQEVCTRVCFDQDDVREILAKCRAYIYLVYKNSNALAALRIQDHLMSLDETPLVSDYPRVWISTYMMLENLLVRRSFFSSILDNIDPKSYDKETVTLSDNDWTLIEDVLSVLEPFKVTIMTLSEEKSPLVSLLKPLLWQLLSCHLKVKPEDSMNAQVFKAAFTSLFSDKYSEPAVSELLQIATTLDPRFKSLPNFMEENKATLKGPVKESLTLLIEQNPEDVKPSVEGTPVKKKPRLSGMVMLLGEICSSSTDMSSKDRANLEIVQYQSEPTAPLDQCPVAWWARSSSKCPYLSRLATQYTCVPATAIPPSRIPVETQINYDTKRANLTPEIVDKLVFLNANYTV